MYIVQKQANEYLLVEKRTDDVPPVILDTYPSDREKLSTMVDKEIDESSFKLIEIPIYGYEGTFHTYAKLE